MSKWFQLMLAVTVGFLFGNMLMYLIGVLIKFLRLFLHPIMGIEI